MIKSDAVAFLSQRHGPLFAFWTQGHAMPEATVEAHCDVVYSLALLGMTSEIDPRAVEALTSLLAGKDLPGWRKRTQDKTVSVHNCAYAFGALNLLDGDRAALYDRVLSERQMDLQQIIDPDTHRPVFPAAWSHHNWRVSHWIGGVPSLIVSLARSAGSHAEHFEPLVGVVRDATDGLIDHKTGLIRAYRSDIVQALFRKLYALRHDPELGDVGGVAHILWVDHALGREYVALNALLAQAQTLFHRHTPFMEGVPYCLDFDIVQIVRTALDQTGADRARDTARARQMMQDIANYLRSPGEGYSLHKLPGALATYHECALIGGDDPTAEMGTGSVDIIERAHWL